MIWFAIFKKNLKVLMRSPGSAVIVLVAPLLIVFVIGFGLSIQEKDTISIGLSGSPSGELFNRVLNSINSSGYSFRTYGDNSSCVSAIQIGKAVACIIFPKQLNLEENSSNEIVLYVDESRINLIYEIIDSLKASIQSENKEITKELSSKMLNILFETASLANSSITELDTLSSKVESLSKSPNSMISQFKLLDLEDVKQNNSFFYSKLNLLNSTFRSLKKSSNDVVDISPSVIDNLQNQSIKDDFSSEINELDETLSKYRPFYAAVRDVKREYESINSSLQMLAKKLANAREERLEILSSSGKLSSNISSLQNDLGNIRNAQQTILSKVSSFTVTNSNLIAQPIKAKVKSVNTDRRRLVYSFPYLLMLVVLFVGMMLPSTLVLIEKKSKAFFRNFVTPVGILYFNFVTFLTAIFLILLQVAGLLIFAYFVLDIPLNLNFMVSSSIILLSIVLFSLLGLLIGNIFNTFEGITMTAISLGLVFLFLSNLVISVESLAPKIQKLLALNPYLLSSESLRRTLLFNNSFSQLSTNIWSLVFYSVIIFGVVCAVLLIKKSRYRSLSRN